jgi:muramidase (phage lysozyme)
MEKKSYLTASMFLFIACVTSAATVDSDIQTAAPLLDRIATGEGTTDAAAQEHDLTSAYDITYAYGEYNPKDSKPLTEMTIGEIKQLQDQMLTNGAESSAVGKYQLLGTTLEGQQNTLGFSDDTIFDPTTQDLFGLSLLERRGYNEWLDGTMSDHDFQKNLAKEWASVADPDTGMSYYGQGVGTTDAQIKEVMAQIKNSASARIVHGSLSQLKRNGDLIPLSETIDDTNAVFNAKLSNPNGKKVRLQVELRRLDEYGGQFDDTQGGLKESDLLDSSSDATAYAYGLIDGDYHWRARAVSEDGTAGEWVDYGNNDISEADFVVSATQIDRPTAAHELQVTPPEYSQIYYGVATSSNDGEAWPFKLTIIGPDSNGLIIGQIEWPSLNSIHEIEGT